MDRRRPKIVASALLAALAATGFAAWKGGRLLERAEERIARLESRVAGEGDLSWEFERRLARVRGEIEEVRTALGSSQVSSEVTRDLDDRLRGAETRLTDIGRAIDAHGSSLEELTESQLAEASEALEQKLFERDRELDRISKQLEAATRLADESRMRLESLDEEIGGRRDHATMWRALVAPIVQLSGRSSVGSGILLPTRERPDGEGHETHVLTAWHVVRDIVDGALDAPVPVSIYLEDGSIRSEEAFLLRRHVSADLALLLLGTTEPVEHAAKLPTRGSLDRVRVFEQIYAVGCPLGNDPMPTPGEIATFRHQVDGRLYWMINAPTYIGNSGGGIFDAETHELLGVFSKIYTHGSLRPTIVPHMGLVTPLEDVYDWLHEEGYAALVPEDAEPAQPATQVASKSPEPL